MKFVILPENDGIRFEPMASGSGFNAMMIKRDYHEPLPVGTIVAMMFRITGYGQDCDGSAMMEVEAVDREGEGTGWTETCLGIYPDSMVVLDDAGELHRLAQSKE